MKEMKEYFQALGCFDYNAANKIANRITKTNSTIGQILLMIAKCEQSYTSLEYLKIKFFRREDVSIIDKC